MDIPHLVHRRYFLFTIVLLCILVRGSSVLAQEEESETPSEETLTPTPPPASEALTELEENQAAIDAKKQEIADLDAKIHSLSVQRDTTQAEAALIADKVARLRRQLEKAQLELRQTQLNIGAVQQERASTEEEIKELQAHLTLKREQLRALIRSLYSYEHTSLVAIFFSTGSLSETLKQRSSYVRLQEEHVALMGDIREREGKLAGRQQALEVQAEDLSNLQGLLAVQQQALASDRREHERFLQAKRAEQVAFDQKLEEAKQARSEIEQDVFTLKSSGITLKLTEATDMARFASKLTGVRAALLLGVLKVETNLGTNIGSGVFPDDMHPDSREAFLRITKKLGLDPNTAPISARPRSYQGWGGAMGPGQFMPATWETIEARVAALVQKPQPSPYDLTDAFVATAIFLADRGATSPAGEYEAVNKYLAGPNWQRFTWYGDRVLAVAKEYEKEGL